jgi:hypothetical protein
VHAWRVGDERAETYLRLLTETELRRAGDELRRHDAAAGDAQADPGMTPFRTSEMAQWKVLRAGRILVAAGVLDQDYLDQIAADLHTAIKVRSRLLINWDRRRGMLHRTIFAPPVSRPSPGAGQAMHVAPIGGTLRVTDDRAPWTLHFLSLVRTETEAMMTVAMRMHWPPGGASADLELTGAGPHHMPYDQLWAVDDQGTRYAVRFEGGRGGTVTWLGIARLSPVPPRHVRRLDLFGDGTRLIQLPLGPDEAEPGRRLAPVAAEPVATGPGERLLVLEAERILASGDVRGPAEGPVPGEIITVLTEAGAIAAGSPVPGQLAALCQRLGAAGHGITVAPAQEIPSPWASVITHWETPEAAAGTDVFVPLACALPDVDGAQLALAGLSTAAGESHVHVISSGMPRLAARFQWDWTPGLSWWLRDSAGNWHVATAGEPYPLEDGMQAFWLRLTPSLATVTDATEVVVTGPATRARATIPVRLAGS